MMIMRFHKLIQSRLLWLVFLGVLVFSFVGWGVATQSTRETALARLKKPVVEIDGKKISFLEYDQTRRILQRTGGLPRDPEAQENAVFNRFAMLSYAHDIGIRVPKELARQQFAANFENEQQLLRFRQSLRGDSLTEENFVEYIHDELVLQNLQRALGTFMLVSPHSVERMGRIQTDAFTLHYVSVSEEQLEDEVTVDEERLASFFKDNKKRYEIPEKRVVDYVKIPIAPFLENVTEIDEEEALDYYQSRPEQYTRKIKRPSEVEGEPAKTVREPIPFEEVRESILGELRRQRALEKARDTAMNYALELTPRRGEPGTTLEKLAESKNLEVRTTEPFTPWQPISELANAQEFKQAAFELDTTDLGRVGGPVRAGDDVVVMVLRDILPPRIPELEEVADQVRGGATNHYQRIEVQTLATNLAEELRNKVTTAEEFKQAAEARGLQVMSPDPFQLKDLNPNMPSIPFALVREAVSHIPGDIIGPVEGRFMRDPFIGFLAARTPNPEAAAELAPQIRNSLVNRFKIQGFTSRLQENVLDPMIKKIEPENSETEEDGDDATTATES